MGFAKSVATNNNNKKGKGVRELEKGKSPVPNPDANPSPKVSSNSRGKKGGRRYRPDKKAAVVLPVQKAAAVLPVQKLYETCKEVFDIGGTGIVPSPENVEKLRAVLDDIGPADVGVNPDMPFFWKTAVDGTSRIRVIYPYQCDKFSIGIFCLPPSGCISLHNHPGMTVFSKLLFGTMHIKSYDWVADVPCSTSGALNSSEVNELEVQQSEREQPKVQQPEVRLAQVKVNSDFTAPCDTRILYPADGGNMHCFTASTACAVLDVLGPPYSDAEGRHCQYYLDFPFRSFSVGGVTVPEEEKDGYAWLQEREQPDNMIFIEARYGGPEIVEK